MKYSCLIFLLFCFSCNPKDAVHTDKRDGAPDNKPAPVVRILPLGNIKASVVTSVVNKLKTIVPNCTVLKAEPLPAIAWYKPRNRYRADSIIHWLSNRAGANEVYIGITSSDISTTKGDAPDFGVMGLGYQPGKACVASDFRLSQKAHFYKIAIHELGHTTGLPHCPVSTCFMRDAKGGNPTGEENSFCVSCTKHLRSKGWSL